MSHSLTHLLSISARNDYRTVDEPQSPQLNTSCKIQGFCLNSLPLSQVTVPHGADCVSPILYQASVVWAQVVLASTLLRETIRSLQKRIYSTTHSPYV